MPFRRGKTAVVRRFDFDLAVGCAGHRNGDRVAPRTPQDGNQHGSPSPEETIDGRFMPLRIRSCENITGGRISPVACFHPGIISPGISTTA